MPLLCFKLELCYNSFHRSYNTVADRPPVLSMVWLLWQNVLLPVSYKSTWCSIACSILWPSTIYPLPICMLTVGQTIVAVSHPIWYVWFSSSLNIIQSIAPILPTKKKNQERQWRSTCDVLISSSWTSKYNGKLEKNLKNLVVNGFSDFKKWTGKFVSTKKLWA